MLREPTIVLVSDASIQTQVERMLVDKVLVFEMRPLVSHKPLLEWRIVFPHEEAQEVVNFTADFIHSCDRFLKICD